MSTDDIVEALETIIQARVDEVAEPLRVQMAAQASLLRKATDTAKANESKYCAAIELLRAELMAARLALRATGASPGDYPDHAGALYAARDATVTQLPPRDRCFIITCAKTRVAAVFSNYSDARDHLRTFRGYDSAELYGLL